MKASPKASPTPPHPRPLSPRQQDLLTFIWQSLLDTGRPPTRVEMAHELDLRSTNGVNDHLSALERKGYIHIEIDIARGVTVLHRPDGRPAPTWREALEAWDREVGHG